MNYDIIIIGGGAAGLFAAINCKKSGNSVLILEHKDRAGQKILSTGNGKCNLTNSFCRIDLLDKNPEGLFPYFTSGEKSFIESVIRSFSSVDTVVFFESLGVLTEDKEGYIYPRSEQASTVNNALRMECARKGVSIETGVHVSSVTYRPDDPDQTFSVNDKYFCRKLVVACGGMAAPKTGSDGSMFRLLEGLGHTVIKPLPALCALRCSEKFFKELKGVRNNSVISLLSGDGKSLITASGNLQFTDNGISGIPVFQISSVACRLLDSDVRISAVIDLLPDISEHELTVFIESYCKVRDCYDLPPVLNNRLINVINKILASAGYKDIESFAQGAAKLIKHFRVTPCAQGSFSEAQTSSGGISTSEIDPDTMGSRIVPGLFFAGEVIDVNGICGGYNLQWAWSTAHIISENI